MTMSNEDRYKSMEETLQAINRNYISLSEDEVKRNNEILDLVVKVMTEKMKKDPLFNELYRNIYYGGSYYTGLKVGKPDEYDIDLVFTLPECATATIISSAIPGFAHVHVVQSARKTPSEAKLYNLMANELLDNNNCMDTIKVSAWMESLIQRAINELPPYSGSKDQMSVVAQKEGPAHTLKLGGYKNGKPVGISIDLVPCFVFTQTNWPKPPYRQNPIAEKREFFVVPKQPHNPGNTRPFWRLSFQEQENVFIKDQGNLKPAIRLLKQLRDKENHKIASYYIKTLFLWELKRNKTLWDKPLSYVFMTMLKKYKQCIDDDTIPYYWNAGNNLIDSVNPETLSHIADRLTIIIDEIERNPAENVAKYLLKDQEVVQLQLAMLRC